MLTVSKHDRAHNCFDIDGLQRLLATGMLINVHNANSLVASTRSKLANARFVGRELSNGVFVQVSEMRCGTNSANKSQSGSSDRSVTLLHHFVVRTDLDNANTALSCSGDNQIIGDPMHVVNRLKILR